MIKNEIITEISRKEKYIRKNIIIYSDKKNKTKKKKKNKTTHL